MMSLSVSKVLIEEFSMSCYSRRDSAVAFKKEVFIKLAFLFLKKERKKRRSKLTFLDEAALHRRKRGATERRYLL